MGEFPLHSNSVPCCAGLSPVHSYTDIYESDPSRRRECLYYLALGHYKLKNYTESKKFTSRLLSKEPGNMQALSLNSMIDEDVRKEGLIGMAIAGGAIAVIGGLTIAALKSFRPR